MTAKSILNGVSAECLAKRQLVKDFRITPTELLDSNDIRQPARGEGFIRTDYTGNRRTQRRTLGLRQALRLNYSESVWGHQYLL